MNPLFQAGLEIQQFLKTKKWQFCFIGGLAVIRWGEPRMTRDIDLCLFTGFGEEKKFIIEILSRFKARIPDAHDFALANRVLLLSTVNGVPIDMSLAGLPFEQQMIQRARPFLYDTDCALVTCSAEDLIVLKAFADRPRDWLDVGGIIARQGTNLDSSYILSRLAPLCRIKQTPEILEKLECMLDAAGEE